MELIRHADLRRRVSVTLTVMNKHVLKAANLTSHSAQDALVDAFMKALTGCVIVRPDPVGYGHGMFGLSEPHPFPDMVTPEDEAAVELARAHPVLPL